MFEMTHEFGGTVTLVTGAGAGIGRASARAFAQYGSMVVVSDIMAESGQETVRMIRETGGQAIFLRADVSKEAEVKRLINTVAETYGRIDFAHNNAGIAGIRASLTQLTEDDWERIINVNLKGVWLCMKFEIPQMLSQGKGAIVNTASTWGFVGAPTACAYVASKHGIIGLTKTAALEYAKNNIRVNAVCPGATRTSLLNFKTQPQREEELIAVHPLGRIGEPEEVAEAVIWLCSDSASFVTGHSLIVDGGFLAQ